MKKLLGFFIFLISFLVPRNKSKWVFGLQRGFADNAKYYLIYLKENHPEIRCIWIASSQDDMLYVRNLCIESYFKWSIKGIFHCLTSKVYIYAYGVGDINVWTSGGAIRVNLWHGIGLKNLYFKANYGALNKSYWETPMIGKIRYFLYLRSDLLLSTSPMMNTHFSECFNIPLSNIITGIYPRCLPLLENKLQNNIVELNDEIYTQLLSTFTSYSKIILYMPTFRDSKINFIAASKINFCQLNNLAIQKNLLILVKLHQNTTLNLDKYSNITIINNKIDPYPILPYTDLLITDYSSIYYDYLLLDNKETILFPFDYEEYISNSRDLAFDYYEYTASTIAYSFNELYNLLDKGNKINDDLNNKKMKIKSDFWGKDIDTQRHITNEKIYSTIQLLIN